MIFINTWILNPIKSADHPRKEAKEAKGAIGHEAGLAVDWERTDGDGLDGGQWQ
jgi:hypothetical protein